MTFSGDCSRCQLMAAHIREVCEGQTLVIRFG